MKTVIAQNPSTADLSFAARDLYHDLPDLDFSRQIVTGAEASLHVLQAPRCRWSDLGTPNRLAQTLRSLSPSRENSDNTPGPLNLSVRYARLQLAAS